MISMLDNLYEKLRSCFYSESISSGKKKKRSNTGLIILLIVGALLMIINSFFLRDGLPQVPEEEAAAEVIFPGNVEKGEKEQLISQLTAILNQIEGISNVKVFLTFEYGVQHDYAYDVESIRGKMVEEDREGGTRENIDISERKDHIVLRDGQGRESALVTREMLPQVKGVLVVARGVDSAVVHARVADALKKVLDVPAHRISVLPGD